jgi:hypothetical protein
MTTTPPNLTILDPSNTSPVKTGAYSLKSTHNAAGGGMYLHHAGVNIASSFSGVNQSSPLDASNATSGWGGNPTMSLTTGTANDLVTATLSRFGTTDATTNRTSLYNSTRK